MPTYPYLTQVVHSAARARPGQPCLVVVGRGQRDYSVFD
jgi:hypothetical protein